MLALEQPILVKLIVWKITDQDMFPLCGIEVYFKLWFYISPKLLLDQHASKQYSFEASGDITKFKFLCCKKKFPKKKKTLIEVIHCRTYCLQFHMLLTKILMMI